MRASQDSNLQPPDAISRVLYQLSQKRSWGRMESNHLPPPKPESHDGALPVSYTPVLYRRSGSDDRCRRSTSFLAGTTPIAVRCPL